MSIVSIWKQDPALLTGKTIAQIVNMCGNGKLRDDNETSRELRELLAHVDGEHLATFAKYCLENPFVESGLALQDIINQIGHRLGFAVTPGKYRGQANKSGHDGLWKSKDEHDIIIEVKTTDAFGVSLETVVGYRSALIAEGRIKKERSSILIVVGRIETDGLESQIRGSRHAWDIRLISIDALIKLMFTKLKLKDWATSKKINELLKPIEYTRIDPIIDLIFTTTEDLAEEHPDQPDDESPASAEPENPSKPNEKAKTSRLRDAAIPYISNHLKNTFVKKGYALFTSSDGNANLVCLASQAYQANDYEHYWYGFTPSQLEFLEEAASGFVAFICGSPEKVLLLPFAEFKAILPYIYRTENKHWHIRLYWKENKMTLDEPLKSSREDVTRYLLPSQRATAS